jgi:hypothetical protein
MMMDSLLCVRVRATYAATGNDLFGNINISMMANADIAFSPLRHLVSERSAL